MLYRVQLYSGFDFSTVSKTTLGLAVQVEDIYENELRPDDLRRVTTVDQEKHLEKLSE